MKQATKCNSYKVTGSHSACRKTNFSERKTGPKHTSMW